MQNRHEFSERATAHPSWSETFVLLHLILYFTCVSIIAGCGDNLNNITLTDLADKGDVYAQDDAGSDTAGGGDVPSADGDNMGSIEDAEAPEVLPTDTASVDATSSQPDDSSSDTSSCEAQALVAHQSAFCPPFDDVDAADPEARGAMRLRCEGSASDALILVGHAVGSECHLRGKDLLLRGELFKVGSISAYGESVMEAAAWFVENDPECRAFDFAGSFVDYDKWSSINKHFASNLLKLGICKGWLHGRQTQNGLAMEVDSPVKLAEMAKILIHSASSGVLVLPSGETLAPREQAQALLFHYTGLVMGTTAPINGLDTTNCGSEWYVEDEPVIQALVDFNAICSDIEPSADITRFEAADVIANLLLGAPTCGGAVLMCSVYPEQQPCETCNSVASCQLLVDTLIAMFPDFVSKGQDITFAAGGSGYCLRSGYTITCPQTWINSDRIITNKLLFHELSHALREDLIWWGGGGYGACSAGSCSSSEFQASLLEDYYFPEGETACGGGHYRFEDTHAVTRYPQDILHVLMKSPDAVSEDALWDYAMGRGDSLTPYMWRFGLDTTSELFFGQSPFW